MDTFTHALSGALLARATARKTAPDKAFQPPPLWQRVTVGALACGFPDIDFVAGYASPLTYLLNHRGVTHSLVLMPAWGLLLAWIAALAFRPTRGWRAVYGGAAMSVGLHILGDLITSFGTMIFAPLSDARFSWGTTFIIDLWFTGIILAGLILSALWRRSRTPAVAACLVLAGYVLFQAAMKLQATEFGRNYAKTQGLTDAKVSALPRAVSPFNWTVVVSTPEAQRYADVNLIRKVMPQRAGPDSGLIARIDANFYPLTQALWTEETRFGRTAEDQRLAREAWEQKDFAFFRWFAEYPALLDIQRGSPGTCVWFHDLRFINRGSPIEPFRYGMCRYGDGIWTRYTMVGENGRAPLN